MPDEPSGPPEAACDQQTRASTSPTVWNLREEGAPRIQSKIDMGDPENGPLALPGIYTLELLIDGKTSTSTLEIRRDPRSPVSDADLAAGHAFALRSRDALTRLAASVARVRAVREQLDLLAKHAPKTAGAETLALALKAAIARVDAIEGTLHNPEAKVNYDILAGRGGGAKLLSQWALLYGWTRDSDHAPTESMKTRADELLTQLAERETALQSLREHELAKVEAEITSLGLPRILMP
jgi:hypothetical protein